MKFQLDVGPLLHRPLIQLINYLSSQYQSRFKGKGEMGTMIRSETTALMRRSTLMDWKILMMLSSLASTLLIPSQFATNQPLNLKPSSRYYVDRRGNELLLPLRQCSRRVLQLATLRPLGVFKPMFLSRRTRRRRRPSSSSLTV